MGRINLFAQEDEDIYNIFTLDEMKEIDKIKKEFEQSIFSFSPECYIWQKYKLPISHFEPSVFYYRHHLDTLINTEYFKDKDIIDAGGYVGDSALVFQEYTNKKVYSFEPTTKNYNYMLKTIALNNAQKIVPVKYALGSKEETSEITIIGMASSIIGNEKTKFKHETINITTLDKYSEENNLNVGLIKTDVEGFEGQLLQGAKKTIEKFKPTLMISIYHTGSDLLDIKPLIESWNLGYEFKITQPIIKNALCEMVLIAQIPKEA